MFTYLKTNSLVFKNAIKICKHFLKIWLLKENVAAATLETKRFNKLSSFFEKPLILEYVWQLFECSWMLFSVWFVALLEELSPRLTTRNPLKYLHTFLCDLKVLVTNGNKVKNWVERNMFCFMTCLLRK